MLQPRSRPDYLDVPFAALAHRGGYCDAAPAEFENSLRAFSAAWELGYRYLETDVHVTNDGVLVAFHDSVLDRVTDASGRIADLSWAEVSRARIGGTEPIPRFEELLAGFPEARFNVDIKAVGAERPLAETLRWHAAEDRVCVGSFSGKRLRQFRTLSRDRSVSAAPPLEVVVLSQLPGVRALWPFNGRVFQVPERDARSGLRIVNRRMIDAAHRRGAAVHVWTINERSDMERLIDLGVDGLVTDNIATLKDVLIARGLWEGNA